jgi:exosortase B
MSTVLDQRGLPEARARWWPWLAVAAGLAALYLPTYFSLAGSLWRDDAHAHGPIILAVFAWLVWRDRAALAEESPPARAPGAALLAAGLAAYVFGRTLSLTPLEVASHLPVLGGIVLMLRGTRALRRLAFPLLFLLFLVPLPGFVLDWATGPLRTLVSAGVAGLLQLVGYPVERSGVVLELGGHQMLVADACSGLNSIFSLFALGFVYAYLTPPRKALRTFVLAASIVPIAVAANVIRVAVLVLLTYYAGEEVAQGFLHGLAGLLVFMLSLGLLSGLDSMIPWKATSKAHEPPAGRARPVPAPVAVLIGLALATSALAVPALKPVPAAQAIDLERALPTSFGDWRLDTSVVPIAPSPDVQANLDRIYRQVVSRTYVNSAGERMMLTVAHGGDQSDALKAHRQEKCYEAQGFEIEALQHGRLSAAGRTIPVTRMVAVRADRVEPVTYWFTMGDRVVLGRSERLRVQVGEGLAGRIPDGMLVRVSSLSPEAAGAFAAQETFARSLFANVAAGDTPRFLGAARG